MEPKLFKLDEIGTGKSMILNFINELKDNKFNFDEVVQFEFNNAGDVAEFTKSKFLYNLIILKPFLVFGYEIGSDYIDEEPFTVKRFNARLDDYIDIFKDYEELKELKLIITEILEELSDVSGLVNIRKGNTTDIFSLIKTAINNDALKKILFYKIDESEAIGIAEKKLLAENIKLVNILKTSDTSLRNFINANIGINPKQLRESVLSIGYKPNLKGDIITKPINTSYLRGVSSSIDYYNNAQGARKALIINFKNVKRAGYLTRKLLLLMLDASFSTTVECCDTKHYLKLNVFNEKILESIENSYFLDEKKNELVRISPKIHKHLIGTVINLRSPITCSAKDGVCKTCYNEVLYEVIKDLHPGILATLFLTNLFTQNLLSSKHMLKVDANELEWPEDITALFSIKKNSINPLKSIRIKINPDEIKYDASDRMYCESMTIIHSKSNTEELYFPTRIYFSREITNELKAGRYAIDEKFLVNPLGLMYITENKEFSKSLEQIHQVLETNDHLIESQEYNEVFNKLIELLDANGINIHLTHIQLIFRELVRSVADNTKKADFSQTHLEETTILRVSSAILKSGSQMLSLSFEKIKQQLKSVEWYLYDSPSRIDSFYE